MSENKDVLKGRKVVLVGELKRMNISEFQKLISENGGVNLNGSYDVSHNQIPDIIVMSDSYLEIVKSNTVYPPSSNKTFWQKYVKDNPDIPVMDESVFFGSLKMGAFKRNRSAEMSKGKSLLKSIKDYIVIDLETTDRYASSSEIIEMAAVKVRNGQIISTYNTLIKPDEPVPLKIRNITGITNEMLENAPKIEDKLQEYLDFIGNDIVVGHNISAFDVNIIRRYCEKLNIGSFTNDMIDTLKYSHYCDIEVSSYRLATIAEYFGIEYHAHRALNDCTANYKVYEKLKEKYNGVYKESDNSENSSSQSLKIKDTYSDISGKNIVLTGDFKAGSRDDITSQLEKLGANVKTGVSGKTNYVIVGALGSASWSFGTYGSKVSDAMEFQQKGKPVEIVKEEDFFE